MNNRLHAMAMSRAFYCLVLLFLASTYCLAQQVTVRRASNLRADASTNSPVQGKLKSGDKATLTGAVKSGYYPVRTQDGKTGWVWAKNLSTPNSAGNLSAANSQLMAAGTGSNKAFQEPCQSPLFPGAPAPIDSKACGIAGSGGAEASQNEAKNNFCASGPPESVTIEKLIQLQQSVENEGSVPFGRSGPATDRTALQALGEGHQVVLVGYVKRARPEGAESVNCGKNGPVPNQAAYHDIHISIVSSPNSDECSGVVVEMTPHHRPSIWTPTLVNRVQSSNLLVRITGNQLFDSSHSPCQNGSALSGDPARASLWEIHPIYRFEVCTDGDCSNGNGWVDLENWQSQ